MSEFENTQFGPACLTLLADMQPMELGPGTPHQHLRAQLAALHSASLWPGKAIADQEMADGCIAGLWLLHNFLDESHQVSQETHTPTGSYWHGLMHRREPDFSNAKYWFRKAGTHPIFAPLQQAARELAKDSQDPAAAFLGAQDQWEPAAFVDLCEAVSLGRSTSESLCREVALAEWQLLFAYCYQNAT